MVDAVFEAMYIFMFMNAYTWEIKNIRDQKDREDKKIRRSGFFIISHERLNVRA